MALFNISPILDIWMHNCCVKSSSLSSLFPYMEQQLYWVACTEFWQGYKVIVRTRRWWRSWKPDLLCYTWKCETHKDGVLSGGKQYRGLGLIWSTALQGAEWRKAKPWTGFNMRVHTINLLQQPSAWSESAEKGNANKNSFNSPFIVRLHLVSGSLCCMCKWREQ